MNEAVRQATDEEKEAAIGVTVSVQIGQGRSIVLQTALPRDADLRDYHATLDKIGEAVDRQEAKYMLLSLKKVLANRQRSLKIHEQQFMEIDNLSEATWKASPRKGEHRLTPAEIARKDNLRTNVEQARIEIASIEADITECELIIDVG